MKNGLTSPHKIISYTEKVFGLSITDLKEIIKNFHSEMAKGLKGLKSSLAMIPAFVDAPTGDEKGSFIALDLGGTHFRILEVSLKGGGRSSVTAEHKFTLKKDLVKGPGEKLFDFIAASVKYFMRVNNISFSKKISLGFTFSFPVRQKSVSSGILICWNKDFSARGVIGKDVVALLNGAMERKGITNVKISALLNDTVGTLAAGAYNDINCDTGVILGTGTNACYFEKTSNVRKLSGVKTPSEHMAINIEWGNFDKLPGTPYDGLLDKATANPGRQALEKMVSGLYLGEISRSVIADLAERKKILWDASLRSIKKRCSLKTEHVSLIEGDNTKALKGVEAVLSAVGVRHSTYADRVIIKAICRAVAKRSASVSGAAIAAVLLRMDPALKKKHIIAIDGSLFEKWPNYRKYMKNVLRAIFKNKAGRIRLSMTKHGSGKGAAIVAAIAAKKKGKRVCTKK